MVEGMLLIHQNLQESADRDIDVLERTLLMEGGAAALLHELILDLEREAMPHLFSATHLRA